MCSKSFQIDLTEISHDITRKTPFCSNENMRKSDVLMISSESNKSRWSIYLSRISLNWDSLNWSLGALEQVEPYNLWTKLMFLSRIILTFIVEKCLKRVLTWEGISLLKKFFNENVFHTIENHFPLNKRNFLKHEIKKR